MYLVFVIVLDDGNSAKRAGRAVSSTFVKPVWLQETYTQAEVHPSPDESRRTSSVLPNPDRRYIKKTHYKKVADLTKFLQLKMDNPFVSCPYNSAHQVLRSRIQAHIVKCEKKYPPLEICPYNASHRFPKSELLRHIADCPCKIVRVEENSEKKYLSTKPKMVNQYFAKPTDPDYECWD